MEDVQYERPRERLRRTGVSSLTTVELLQVLVGSGNSRVSSARIAKNVAVLLDSSASKLSLSSLLDITGLGNAKACQILAGIELGARLSVPRLVQPSSIDTTMLRAKSKTAIQCSYINASGVLAGSFFGLLGNRSKDSAVIKSLFGEALAKGARSIEIAIGCRTQDIQAPSTATLDVLHKIYSTADLLQITVKAVYLVNKNTSRHINRGIVS